MMRLILSSDQAKVLDVTADLVELGSAERLKISLKKFSIFFAVAVASVFVPVFHFFLVPLFLLVSIVAGLRAYSTRYRWVLREQSRCLQCEGILKSEFLLNEDLRLKCQSCSAHYLVDR